LKRVVAWVLIAGIWLAISLFLCLSNSCN